MSIKKVTKHKRVKRNENYSKIMHSEKLISIKCRNSACNRVVHNCHPDTISVLCPVCTCMLVPLNNKEQNKTVGYLRGWKLMKEFVHADGTVYQYGVEQPELKGKITPTDVESIKQQQKEAKVKNKKLKEERAQRKEERLLKQYHKGQKERAKKIKDKQIKLKELKEKKV